MQQRRLRLGDILDDYCPRERRITNHAVVAMIEDEVRQTRCTTCDAEHEFKQAKLPTLRKKKESVSAAYKEVLAGVVKDANAAQPPAAEPQVTAAQETSLVPEPAQASTAVEPETPPAAARPPVVPSVPRAAAPAEGLANKEPVGEGSDPTSQPVNGDAEGAAEGEAGRVHRRLIRATLPRPENHQAVRPVPEFTMRQPAGRGGKFRPAGARTTQRPGATRGGGMHTGGRGGFPRTASGRGAHQGARVTGRTDGPRARGGQPPRHGKKHSK